MQSNAQCNCSNFYRVTVEEETLKQNGEQGSNRQARGYICKQATSSQQLHVYITENMRKEDNN